MSNEKENNKKEAYRTVTLETPISDDTIQTLRVGDFIEINGVLFCGRDAVLPKVVGLVEAVDNQAILSRLKGSVIFHTAVSIAGVGPTTSNKLEIEGSIPALSKAGVKIHLGKGALNPETTAALQTHHSVFAITPPTSAYFSSKIVSKKVFMFPEEGMEALYELEVKGFPAIVAIAHGESIFT